MTKEAGDPDINAIIQSQNVVFRSKQIKLEEQLNLIGRTSHRSNSGSPAIGASENPSKGSCRC